MPTDSVRSYERNKILFFGALGVEFIFSNPRGLTDMFCIGYIGLFRPAAAKWRSCAHFRLPLFST